ncbi:hypothetical protein GGF50DRAFT_121648 [Schizophyllum commune]
MGYGSGSDDDDDTDAPPPKKDKGKGRAPPPPQWKPPLDPQEWRRNPSPPPLPNTTLPRRPGEASGSGAGASQSKKDKGKGRAPPAAEDDGLPTTTPGVFDAGDFLADDAELPNFDDLFTFDDDPSAPGPSSRPARASASTSGGGHTYATGPISADALRQVQESAERLVNDVNATAKETKKSFDTVWRQAGWLFPESMRSRAWHRYHVFTRHWAATHEVDPSESAQSRRKRMDKAYNKKLAKLGDNPTEEELAAHFKEEYDFCVSMQEELLQNATARQRQRVVNAAAQQLSRIALGALLNSGLAIVGYVVDLRGGAKGAVNSAMFGGGPPYAELLRRYPGNFTAAMNEMTTILRLCDLRLRGLPDETDLSGIVTPLFPPGWYPDRDWDPETGKNRSDELLRILYELLRWDLGVIYVMANRHLSSQHAEVPSQFPRASFPDIAYRLCIVLANWPLELQANIPMVGTSRKPSGRSWSAVVASLIQRRRDAERESNRLGLSGEAALLFLQSNGAPVLAPLPRHAIDRPLIHLGANPIVQSPAPRSYDFLRWRSSPLYQSDVRNLTDSRIRWQSYWGDQRDNGRVDNSDDDSDDDDDDDGRRRGRDLGKKTRDAKGSKHTPDARRLTKKSREGKDLSKERLHTTKVVDEEDEEDREEEDEDPDVGKGKRRRKDRDEDRNDDRDYDRDDSRDRDADEGTGATAADEQPQEDQREEEAELEEEARERAKRELLARREALRARVMARIEKQKKDAGK